MAAPPLSPSMCTTPPPETFLSPRITAELDDALGAIEELLLSGGVDGMTSLPSSPTKIAAQHLEGDTTPSAAGRTRREAGSSFLDLPLITNAVHMEVQENSRLPTFNLQVDRTKSSWQSPALRGRKRSRPRGGFHPSRSPSPKLGRVGSILAIDEMMRLNEEDLGVQNQVDPIVTLHEEDINLFEWFMDGEERSSAALAYSFSQFDDMSFSDCGCDDDGDSNSKTKGKGVGKLSNGANRQELHFPSKLHNSTSIPWRHYNRSKPLPIPILKTSSSTPGGSSNKVAAVRFAASTTLPAVANGAALSIQLRAPRRTSTTQTGGPSQLPSIMPRLGLPAAGNLFTAGASGPRPIPQQPLLPPRYPFPPGPARHYAALHAAAHSVPKASITHATVQRSKFGFGQQHKVPSVPGLPPKSTRKGMAPASSLRPLLPPRPQTSANADSVAGKPPEPHPSSAFPLYKPLPPLRHNNPQSPSLPDNVGSVEKYERKKQRAKDARIRLNEAIDELAVAIDLAGSQSKERLNYVVKITDCGSNKLDAVPSSAAGRVTAPISTHHLQVKFFDDTIQQASTAKKWDRPSFIGLSATIINSLNAQCESLMREVALLRSTAKEKEDTESADISATGNNIIMDITPHSLHDPSFLGRSSIPELLNAEHAHNSIPVDQSAICELPIKSNELHSSNGANSTANYEERLADAMHSTVTSPNLLQHIALFMDPSSLCKCMCVSKRWKSQNIFNKTDIWLNMCSKRFGVSAVRKWQDSGHDDYVSRMTSKDANLATFNMYRQMAEMNIKPYCAMDGTQFLGGATSDGLVSCWVSLMDRSNGETSRSVIQNIVKDGKMTISYAPIPVVELRLLVQNTGYSRGVIVVPNQQFTVDASTRRKGEKMLEVSGDERFNAQVLNIERSSSRDELDSRQLESLSHRMCNLRLFESAVLSVHIHARGCSTTAKFCNRSKKIQLLFSFDGTTRSLTIPFHCTTEAHWKLS